ncbi:unnamed protein product [Phytophthora lilii]|uniref:CST complex subunit CTC1 n=1 Tax=Phytophthora lilii TaxID=2077276 RepID=A0A9W6TGJ7_9STRA|nr:unnamed protein product [Phytophthora lilii]
MTQHGADAPQIWSVGKLLRVLQEAKAAAAPLEALAQHGITRCSVGRVDQRRSTSQPTTAETQQAPSADAVSYSSSWLWLTGVLHFGEELGACDTLHLCDSNARLPSFLLDPSPLLVDQLVLVKRWVLVDKAFGGVRTADSLFLEVRDEKPVTLLPVGDPYAHWTQDNALKVLETNYLTKDPPMYSGTEPWAVVAARTCRNGANNEEQPVVSECSSKLDTTGKHKKRKRFHAVFGRVTSLSPISRQKESASSHFFVEIECHRSSSSSSMKSVVSVMFAGVYNMRWHLFLQPGQSVLVTDLTKVLSRECEMFLLQATNGCHSGDCVNSQRGSPNKGQPQTLVLVWDELPPPQVSVAQRINESLSTFSKSFVSRCYGKLLNYEGQVCRLVWDECIELVGCDGARVTVCLFHFPYTDELVRLREGATVRICDAHILLWPTPVGGRLVIGLCPRSHFTITSYSNPSSPCLAVGSQSRRGRPLKKWSSLGDFHRQSMMLSMWLLDVLESLDTKFIFGEDGQTQSRLSSLSFPKIRRRHAVSRIAKGLGLPLCDSYDQAAMTLGALFLKCHSANASNCVTLRLPSGKLSMFNRALSIRELKMFGERKLREFAEEDICSASRRDGPLFVKVSADSLDWCLLLGSIRGNVDKGDLEIYDRTGSISLRLNGNDRSMQCNDAHGVYLINNFDLVVEDYNTVQDPDHPDRVPLIQCVSCVAANVNYVPLYDDTIEVECEMDDVRQRNEQVTTQTSPDPGRVAEQTPTQESILELTSSSISQRSEEVSQVCSLLYHPLINPRQSADDDVSIQPVVMTVDPDIHKSHLVSVTGMIVKKKYYWRSTSQKQSAIGIKRTRDLGGNRGTTSVSRKRLVCIIEVRDFQHLDTVDIRVDASRFGVIGSLQANDFIELTRLQGFIARSSYKVYLNWSHLTEARPAPAEACGSVPRTAELYNAMPTMFLNDLYSSSCIDRRLHRYVVGVKHISYALLKRKCTSCHQALQLNRQRGCWKHADADSGSAYYRDCVWSRLQWTPSDPAFRARTYMGTTVRCIIDDGSAQAELFLENDVAWELLTCTDGQRRRFEDILSNYVDELSYFSGRAANGSFATSKAEREQEYYQNELRAFVLAAIPSLRSIVVFAQQFYRAKQQKEGTAVLTFGKDIQITTRTAPQPKLEAKRVDPVHVRSELRRRLARLRAPMTTT